MTTDIITNERIQARTVRIVDNVTGKQIGLYNVREALTLAYDQSADLIQIIPGDVPVCRITNASKFIYERKKQLREAAKHQRELAVDTKEIQLRPVTSTNDICVKSRKANGFLASGDKVKIVVRFRGRERFHKAEGYKVLDEFLSYVGEHKIDRAVAESDKDLQLLISPTKTKAEILKEKTLS